MSINNGKYPCGVIEDGKTLTGYIAGVPRLYPPLRFKYRPILIQNRSRIFFELTKLKPEQQESLSADAIKRYVVEWDLVDSDGRTVSLTVANILRMQPALNVRLFAVVMGQVACDEDADCPTHDDSESRHALELALAAGSTEALDEIERAEAKNS